MQAMQRNIFHNQPFCNLVSHGDCHHKQGHENKLHEESS